MTRAAQQTVVFQSAFPAPVGYRDDVIGFPAGTRRAPDSSGGSVTLRRFRPGPFAVCLDHVEAAQLAGSFVAFLDLLAHVPGAAANLPLVYALVTAERAPRRLHRALAPAADRISRVVALRNAPLIRGYHARAASAHA